MFSVCFYDSYFISFAYWLCSWLPNPSNPDNTHLSQRRPLDVVLGRLQRPKDSPYFGVLVFGTGFGCGNVRLVIIPLLFPAQPMGRLQNVLSTYFTPPFINNKIFTYA